jgi:hypothetical protein
MSTVNNLDDAYNNAISVFDTAGVDTGIVDDAYNYANSWTNSASAAWDSTEDTVMPDDVVSGYNASKAATFWQRLRDLYSATYGVSDSISAYLDSAGTASGLEASNAYGQRIGAQAIGEATAQTLKDVGNDVKNAGKIGLPAILIGGALFLWATS